LTDNANLTFDGDDLLLDDNAVLSVIDSTTSIYVETTGDDDTGDGSSGNPYATLEKAYSSLSNKLLAAVVTIRLGDGTFTAAATRYLSHLTGSKISITGTNTYTKSLTSVQSSSGGATAWTYVLNVDSVANIAAGDYIIIRGCANGTKPTYLCGCFPVTDVDVGNTRITITSTHKSATPASDAVTGTITVLKTILETTSGNGLDINRSALNVIDKVALVGPGTATYYGIYLYNQSTIYQIGNSVGFYNWKYALSVQYLSSIRLAVGSAFGGCHTAFYMTNYASVSLSSNTVINGCAFGTYVSLLCSGNIAGVITGCQYGVYSGYKNLLQGISGTVIEACTTRGLHSLMNSYATNVASMTFRDNTSDVSPALDTLGNNESKNVSAA
jgi:hypothetical protein